MFIVNNLKETLVDIYHLLLSGLWNKLENPKDKYTVILPVIPEFYGITEYNLRFLTSCNLKNCDQIIVVSDSPKYYDENKNVIDKYSSSITRLSSF